ncbi:MAG TPA: glycine oxidase ThiO [Gemmatimonadales bacterium]|nr:glycine oxidase ThiO [Gemmatimonadales bacterium]
MSHKVSPCEVLVAGGGIIGAACARALALRGLRVLICEPGPEPAAASAASAGILGPQIERTDEALRALGLRARDLYDTLASALAETTGIDIGLWREGIASLAFEEADAERLRDAVAHQRQAGLRCDWLEPADVADRFPATAPCLGAMFAPEDGAVDAPALARALRADAQRSGAQTLNARVNRLTTILGRATGVETTAGKIKAEHVIIAAGAWSTAIEHLPRRLPVEPVRGQMAAAPWPADMPRTVLYYDHGYVLARGGEAIFGSTMERVGFDGGVTQAGITEIVAAAQRLLPHLPSVPTRTWAGLRPVTPDGRPIVGPDPEVRGLWYATGHGRNGVLLAALTGEIIVNLITTGASEIEIASLAPERFTS